VIIGELADLHVDAVQQSLAARGVTALVLNSGSLPETRWCRTIGAFTAIVEGEWVQLGRVWCRRLAPAGAHVGIAVGSREAAELTARLTLIASLSDIGEGWLSGYWDLLRAENKLVQYDEAARLGLRVPTTAVVSSSSDVPEEIGDPMILKPLGAGEFHHEEVAFAVHASVVDRNHPGLDGMGVAPFLAQRLVSARRHLRVVTVEGAAWSAELDAENVDTDWRRTELAHSSWHRTEAPTVERQALELAGALRVGYSSQDWIEDQDGNAWFVDLNPGGQWLFLPPPLADAVTERIATWLVGSGRV
jgi:hypothetical protein